MANELRFRASIKDDVSSPLDRIRDKFDLIRKQGTKGFGIGVGAAVAAKGMMLLDSAASTAVDALKGTIDAASNLDESLAKSRVVFGKNADEIEKWADTASTAFGQTKQQALEAAGTYGNLFQAFGVGVDEATRMSKSLVQLAADLASFNNTSIDDALLALRSGLSGETEPLKRYGIAISDARMRTELAAMGFKDLGATLTPLQKSTAAYALIMKDSALAQGDFARTSDGLANKQRILDAKLGDLSAKIGGVLIPAFTGLVDVGLSAIDMIEDFGDAVHNVGQNIGPLEKSITGTGVAFDFMTEKAGQSTTSLTQSVMGAGVAFDFMTKKAVEAVDESTKAVEDGRMHWQRASSELANELPAELDKAKSKAIKVASKTPRELADALLAARKDWKDALKQLTEDMEKELTPWAERAQIRSVLASKAVLKGLQSQDPAIRAQWAAFVKEAESRLASLEDPLFNLSFRAGTAIGDALKKAAPGTEAAAHWHELAVKNALGQLGSASYGWGARAGRSFADGLGDQTSVVSNAARKVARVVSSYLKVSSPAEKGPLSLLGGPEGWGKRFGTLYGKGLGDGLPNIGGLLGAPSTTSPAQQSTVQNFNLTVQGMPVRDEREMLTTMRTMVTLATGASGG